MEAAQSTLALALQTWQTYKTLYEQYKTIALKEIAIAQAEINELEAAKLTLDLAFHTAKQISSNYQAATVLKEIAITRIQLGQEAHNLTPLILIERNEHLSQIAAALVEADD